MADSHSGSIVVGSGYGSTMVPVETSTNMSMESPSFDINSPEAWDVLGAGRSVSNEYVTGTSAMRVAAFFQAVWMISGDVGKLPLNLYRRVNDDSREIEVGHHAHRVASIAPNKWMSPLRFWRRMMVQYLVYGNAYAVIHRRGNGQIDSLEPLLSDRTVSDWQDGRLWVVTEKPYDSYHSDSSRITRMRY